LLKYLCDSFDIECQLKRGSYADTDLQLQQPHAWNIIKLGTHYFVADIMHEPTQLHPVSSTKAASYISSGPSGVAEM
jgi:transglutaminase/protease-like cytokinesis protein 3